MGLAPSQNMAAATQQLSQSMQIEKDLTSVVASARTAPRSFKDPVARGVVNAVQCFNADEKTLKDAFSQAIGGLKRAAKDASMDYPSENVLGGILSSLKSVFENARDTGEGLDHHNSDKQLPLSLRSMATSAALPYLQFNGCRATLPNMAGGIAANYVATKMVTGLTKAMIEKAAQPKTEEEKTEEGTATAKKELEEQTAKVKKVKSERNWEENIAQHYEKPQIIRDDKQQVAQTDKPSRVISHFK